MFKEQGKNTALVTTSYITDATPAVFGAHESDRANVAEIAADYFHESRPNVLLGADNGGLAAQADEAGYTVVNDKDELHALAAQAQSVE